jgi:general secretion pathway protein G
MHYVRSVFEQMIRPKQVIVRPAVAGVLTLLAWGCTPPSIALKARETILKESLRTIRKLIDQYAVDQNTLPSSLDDLVLKGYVRELPIDSITGKADWDADIGESTIGGTISRGVIDVHSKAPGKSSDGVSYRDY